MLTPLQFGIPGAVELIVLFLIFALLLVIPAAIGYWISQDSGKRGSDHHLAGGVTAFLMGFMGLYPLVIYLVFYLLVRDDIGEIGG